MLNNRVVLSALLSLFSASALFALEYPGMAPGKAKRSVAEARALLENAVIRGEWKLDSGRVASLIVEDKHTARRVTISTGHLPCVVIAGGRLIDLAKLRPVKPWLLENNAIVATFDDDQSGLNMRWSATLDDSANAIIQSLQVSASRDIRIKELVFIDAIMQDSQQVGHVDGSVVVCGDIFLAVEHPLARNTVGENSRVRCALPRGNVLKAGHSWTHSCVVGVVPSGQLRRGFLCYLEHRRAHPYRQFLHYNNWYDVWLGRQTERVTEAECLETIEYFGHELVEKRGVKLDAFVWDDGWDDFNTLWEFHKGFPDGFKKLNAAAKKYGAGQGVWMSPWGGYATAKRKRIEYGKLKGYETNASGFSMSGKKYGKAFREACLKMMRQQSVIFFKFDGMGGGNQSNGAEGAMADDIDAVLALTRRLHGEKPDLFISATVGTWASPFWLLYADSIWRQGGDSGHYGKGDTRQQWLNYRDKFCYEQVVQAGPLYPLNSLMLHGVMIGNRKGRAPSGMAFNEKSVADEIWSFFGSGTCLQEMYVSPNVMTDAMTDTLAAAAKWARDNSCTLVDTHWIGGDPAKAEVYGWASFDYSGKQSDMPYKAIVVLRNPSEKAVAYELPLKEVTDWNRKQVKSWKISRRVYGRAPVKVAKESLNIELAPFSLVLMELSITPY